MAQPKDTSTPKTDAQQAPLSITPQRAKWLAIAALVAASVPHFFLETPLGFYFNANVSGWLGLTIWAPTFLAAIALFVGADATAAAKEPVIANIDARMAAGLSIPIAAVGALAYINFEGYQHVGDWADLGLAMLVYAGIFSVGTFFWQALLQNVVLGNAPRLVRPFVVAAAGAALWLPFLAGHPWSKVGEPFWEHAIVYLGLALLFELGLSVFAVAGVGLLLGVGYAWVHQLVFF
jgi:hypothetical protein